MRTSFILLSGAAAIALLGAASTTPVLAQYAGNPPQYSTPAEQAQWDQFAEVMRDNAREMNKAAMEHAQQVPSMGAVEDLKSYEQLAEAHVQRLQKLIPAFESLYNTMPAQQKQVADQVFRANVESRAQNRPGQ